MKIIALLVVLLICSIGLSSATVPVISELIDEFELRSVVR